MEPSVESAARAHFEWIETDVEAQDAEWNERLTHLLQKCSGVKTHQEVGQSCVGVLSVRAHREKEAHRRVNMAVETWRDLVVARDRRALVGKVGVLAARWAIIPGDNTRLPAVMKNSCRRVVWR